MAFEIGVIAGFEKVRSAHIQLPLELISALREDGQDVRVFTNTVNFGTHLPGQLSNCPIVYLPDPRVRKDQPTMYAGSSKRVHPLRVVAGIVQLARYCRKEGMAALHFFGGNGVGAYAAAVGLFAPDTKIIWTPSTKSDFNPIIARWITRNVDQVTTSTLFLGETLEKAGIESACIRHGALRKLQLQNSPKTRVTFWRDPSRENGADLALRAFERLAEKHPNITFTFLVRPHHNEVALETKFKNIEIYRYPYAEGVSLEKILSETIVCYFPFRRLSTNPQLCILESLEAGLPCVVSDIESVKEYNLDERLLVPSEDLEAGILGIERVLESPTEFNPPPPASNGFNWLTFLDSYKKIYGFDQ